MVISASLACDVGQAVDDSAVAPLVLLCTVDVLVEDGEHPQTAFCDRGIVLNEGVDVPEANIGIIVSGGASVREHVQRLGRILRAKPGKKAVLYELVNSGTSELNVLARRREHRAYAGKISGEF